MDAGTVETTDQLVSDIQALQEKEKEYYEKLNVPQIDDKTKERILSKLEQMYKMRIYMYSLLKNSHAMYAQNASKTGELLDDQIIALEIVEKELDTTKKDIEKINAQKTNKIRQTQINTYYGERYSVHSRFLITIILTGICILPLIFIRNRQWIPQTISNVLISAVFFIGGFFIIYQLIDMYNRSNMNYNQYDWYFNKENAPVASGRISGDSMAADTPWTVTPTSSCVGAACCYQGSSYDVEANKCIPNSV